VVHHPKNDHGSESASSLIRSSNTDPIAAIATASGRGSIGVIRVSGPDLQSFATLVTGVAQLWPRVASYLPIFDDDGSLIDTTVVIYFQAPHSYTGEDVLEIQGHGGNAVLELLLNRCLKIGKEIGLRLAEPGEFSLRAFLNDKVDLAQAEAIADLIDASSTAAAKAAAASLSGAFSREVDVLAQQLEQVRTLVEATLDFPEEEIEFIEKYQVKDRLNNIQAQLALVLDVSRKSRSLKTGLKVVLAGEPNVGKSSLLNAIFGQDIAIVTDIAGTTRDRIRETLDIEGVPIVLTDTAGLRQTDDPIEKIGIERTWQAIKDSDLILNILDIRDPVPLYRSWPSSISLEGKDIVDVYNKCDLLDDLRSIKTRLSDLDLVVSAKSGVGIELLKTRILEQAGRQLGDVSPWLGRTRHIRALEACSEHLNVAIDHADLDDRVLDLLAEELRLAHDCLGSITGHTTADELLGKIFSSFCIGK